MVINLKENKLRWTKGCSARISRLREQYLSFVPSIDIERALSYTKSYKETENEVMCIRRAKALKRTIEEKTITILPDELLVGTRGFRPRAAEILPEIYWRWIEKELDTVACRAQDPYFITEEQKRILKEEVFPYWNLKSMEEFYDANVSDELKNIVFDTGIVFGGRSQCGPGTISANYNDIVLKKGYKGIKEDAEKKLKNLDDTDINNFSKKKFLESVLIVCETMKILGKRHADKAREIASNTEDNVRRDELLKIAEICEKVPYEPSGNFREAIQAVWFNQFMMFTEENADSYCMGRLDQFLYPFYRKDKEKGLISDYEVLELLECLWIKSAEIIWTLDEESTKYYSGYQPFHGVTCGGLTRDGKDATNELSYMMVQASMDIGLHCPSLSVRIHPGTTKEFLMHVIDLIKMGTGQPSIHFDPAAIKILTNKGVSIEDARDWAVVGCIEPQIPGKMCQSDEGSRYNMASAVELVFFNGKSKILDRKVGLSTGELSDFREFKEFKSAVKKQLAFIIKQSCINAQMIDLAHREKLPKPLISSCVSNCVENCQDVTQGGAIYNTGLGIQATGLADLVDSVYAVKRLIYDQKRITMEELKEAIEADFSGFEEVRLMLINKVEKYGNDIDEVDDLAMELAAFASEQAASYKDNLGSSCINGIVSVSANVSHGVLTWALPSGRKAKEPLADGCGPFMGFDKEGPTAVIKSVCKIDHTNQLDGILLNMKFNPEIFNSENGRKNFIALLKSEMELGGYHIQFNVVDNDTLLKAQRNPEDYTDLMVRVAGYSARFIDLHKDVQDSIIKRTEHLRI